MPAPTGPQQLVWESSQGCAGQQDRQPCWPMEGSFLALSLLGWMLWGSARVCFCCVLVWQERLDTLQRQDRVPRKLISALTFLA